MTATISTEERVSRLEASQEHLATREDVALLRSDLYRVALYVVIANATINATILAALRWLG